MPEVIQAFKEGLLDKAEARAVILSYLPAAKAVADARHRIEESS